MSWSVEVAYESGLWQGDQICFATRAEAEGRADELRRGSLSIRATRVTQSSDEVNLSWIDGELAFPSSAARHLDGRTAVVIACGRSVADVCVPLLKISTATTVAVNNAVRFAPFADYIFTLDTTHLEERMRFIVPPGQRVAAVPDHYFDRRHRRSGRFRQAPVRLEAIRYVQRIPFAERHTPQSIMTGCSGCGALQFAYKFLGAKEIILLGCDHDDQGIYVYGDEPDERHAANWRRALRHWDSLALPPDVTVWNASKASRIQRFPRVSAASALQRLGLPAVPVVTVLRSGGAYREAHVEWLQRQIGQPIICLTDSPRAMRDVVSVPLKYRWPGWWSKMELFRPDLCLGNFLYLDLDTVVLGGVPEALAALDDTHVLADLYGHPWIQSCIMFVHHRSRGRIWRAFSTDPEGAMRDAGAGGDQLFLTRFLHDSGRLEDALPGGVISYKADVRRNRFHDPGRGSLESARFVCFHGRPRPWELDEAWIPPLSSRPRQGAESEPFAD